MTNLDGLQPHEVFSLRSTVPVTFASQTPALADCATAERPTTKRQLWAIRDYPTIGRIAALRRVCERSLGLLQKRTLARTPIPYRLRPHNGRKSVVRGALYEWQLSGRSSPPHRAGKIMVKPIIG